MATEIEPQPADDVVMVLTNQHERVRALLAELHETVTAVADITRDMAEPFRELVQLLVAHETAEELVVYPTLKTELEEGRLAGARMAEEVEMKHMLAKLEKMATGFRSAGSSSSIRRTRAVSRSRACRRSSLARASARSRRRSLITAS